MNNANELNKVESITVTLIIDEEKETNTGERKPYLKGTWLGGIKREKEEFF